ncbi:MAG: hypothetical protein PHF86_14275 [Candidatus Nanoarchaeia archaeon]|nr:hypothetical protein [Candidatus Nanoarchaeia archaeon]
MFEFKMKQVVREIPENIIIRMADDVEKIDSLTFTPPEPSELAKAFGLLYADEDYVEITIHANDHVFGRFEEIINEHGANENEEDANFWPEELEEIWCERPSRHGERNFEDASIADVKLDAANKTITLTAFFYTTEDT